MPGPRLGADEGQPCGLVQHFHRSTRGADQVADPECARNRCRRRVPDPCRWRRLAGFGTHVLIARGSGIFTAPPRTGRRPVGALRGGHRPRWSRLGTVQPCRCRRHLTRWCRLRCRRHQRCIRAPVVRQPVNRPRVQPVHPWLGPAQLRGERGGFGTGTGARTPGVDSGGQQMVIPVVRIQQAAVGAGSFSFRIAVGRPAAPQLNGQVGTRGTRYRCAALTDLDQGGRAGLWILIATTSVAVGGSSKLYRARADWLEDQQLADARFAAASQQRGKLAVRVRCCPSTGTPKSQDRRAPKNQAVPPNPRLAIEGSGAVRRSSVHLVVRPPRCGLHPSKRLLLTARSVKPDGVALAPQENASSPAVTSTAEGVGHIFTTASASRGSCRGQSAAPRACDRRGQPSFFWFPLAATRWGQSPPPSLLRRRTSGVATCCLWRAAARVKVPVVAGRQTPVVGVLTATSGEQDDPGGAFLCDATTTSSIASTLKR